MTNEYYEKNTKKHKQTNKKKEKFQKETGKRHQNLSEEEKDKKCQYYQ